MSVEEAKRLDADIRNDEALAEAFGGIDDIDDFVAKANEHGYAMSVEELKQAMASTYTQVGDEALDAVVGGTSRPSEDYILATLPGRPGFNRL